MSENINSIDYKNIKNQSELKKILDSLYEQGFGYINEYTAHNSKVNKIINKSNTYNIELKNVTTNKLYSMTDYNDIKIESDKLFSNFGANHKISEIISKFYLRPTLECRYPSSYPNDEEVISWYNMKLKFNLKDEYESNNYISYYDLDKPTIKIHFNNVSTFRELYKLILNTDCPDFNLKDGGWKDLGIIKIKNFDNGNADITGNISKFVEEYYKELLTHKYSTNIIKYHNKIEIYKKTTLD